jgi:hypothetical protein
LERLRAVIRGKTLDLDLFDGLAVVCGYSATGKTYLARLLKAVSVRAVNKDEENGVNITWARKLVFLNYQSTPTDIENLGTANNKIIVIDNANYLCQAYPKLINIINNDDKNSYLIFGRPPFGINFNYGPATLKYENNTFSLEYEED